VEESANVTIRLDKKFKRFLEAAAKSRHISVSALFKQGAICWLEKEGISHSEFVKIDYNPEDNDKKD
jgi:hypothetical protein